MERTKLFDLTQGKSTREVEQGLIALSPTSAIPAERARVIAEDKTELRLVINQELHGQLKELQAIHSHRMKNPQSVVELLGLLAADALKDARGR